MGEGKRSRFRWLPTELLAGVVLVHDLTQALPWLAAIVASSVVGTVGVAGESVLLLGLAAGLGSVSTLILLVSFLVWYFEKRRTGWKQRATNSEEKLGGQQVLVDQTERMALALTLIRDINLSPLEISDERLREEMTREWLTRYMMPAMSRISPGVGIGLLEWERVTTQKGEYRLRYDSGVPEVVRSVLPKRTSRDFITCLAILQLKDHHSSPVSDEMQGPSKNWLVAFPEQELDLAAKAVFSTGVRIISDAWRGLELGSDGLPA